MSGHASPSIPLPRAWPARVASAALHAVALARIALLLARGGFADSPIARVRRAAELDAAVCALAHAREEARILRARVEGIEARRRPHYAPEERLAILVLRAAAGWTAAETARRFAVTEQTVANWMRVVRESGEQRLLCPATPVNRFPDFVGEMVRAMKATLPSLGRVRIAQVLARAGVQLAASTVTRMLARKVPPKRPGMDGLAGREKEAVGRVVTAKYTHHVWHVDLTVLPLLGAWVPWVPQSLAQRWHFAVWLSAGVDHFSRSVVGWRVHLAEPRSRDVCAMLDRAARRAGRHPKYIVSDRGAQFQGQYRTWCARRGVEPRFGALYEHGSLAVIERFFGSLKREMWRVQPLLPMRVVAIERHVAAYVEWYDAHRPHRALGGRLPRDVREGGRKRVKRIEPRARYPAGRGVRRAASLALRSGRLRGEPHLPVFAIEVRRAA